MKMSTILFNASVNREAPDRKMRWICTTGKWFDFRPDSDEFLALS